MAVKRSNASKIRVESLLLCDFAKVENGKFYILGAGWDQLTPETLPVRQTFIVAIKLVIPVEYTKKPLSLAVGFIDRAGGEIGSPIALDFGPQDASPDEVEEIPLLMPLIAQVTINEPGRYGVVFHVNKKQAAETWFSVRPPIGETNEPDPDELT